MNSIIDYWSFLIEKNFNELLEYSLFLEGRVSQKIKFTTIDDFLLYLFGEDKSGKIDTMVREIISDEILKLEPFNSNYEKGSDFSYGDSSHKKEFFRFLSYTINDNNIKELENVKIQIPISELKDYIIFSYNQELLSENNITALVLEITNVEPFELRKGSGTSNSYVSSKINFEASFVSSSKTIAQVESFGYICLKQNLENKKINKKALTPNKVLDSNILGTYISIDNFFKGVKDKNLRNFLQTLYENMSVDGSALESLSYIYKLQSTGKYEHKINPTFKFGDENDISLIKFVNKVPNEMFDSFRVDFSEVFGAISLAKICSKIKNIGNIYIKFPKNSNYPLADYFISNTKNDTENLANDNSFKISAKAGEGASPSADSVLNMINEFIEENGNDPKQLAKNLTNSERSEEEVEDALKVLIQIRNIFGIKKNAGISRVNQIFSKFACLGKSLILNNSKYISDDDNSLLQIFEALKNLSTVSVSGLDKSASKILTQIDLNDISANKSISINDYIYVIKNINESINSSKKDTFIGTTRPKENDDVNTLFYKLIYALSKVVFSQLNSSKTIIDVLNRLFSKKFGTFIQVYFDDTSFEKSIDSTHGIDISFEGKAVSGNGEKLTSKNYNHEFYFEISNQITENGVTGSLPKIKLH